jgi:hypothetical protein
MRKAIALLAFACPLAFFAQANATVVTEGFVSFDVTDLAPGVNAPGKPSAPLSGFLERFNKSPAPAPGSLADFTAGPLTFSSSGAEIVKGSLGGQYQAPYMHGSQDKTPYLTVFGGTTETITLAAGDLGKGFGLYIGSLDAYNSITFYSGTNEIFSVSGSQIAAATGLKDNGSTTGYDSNRYVEFQDLDAGALFTSVVLSSTKNSFEVDNIGVAYDAPTSGAPPVPEASTWVMMILGFLGLGLVGVRRRVGLNFQAA